jgi:hypothetical protein
MCQALGIILSTTKKKKKERKKEGERGEGSGGRDGE